MTIDNEMKKIGKKIIANDEAIDRLLQERGKLTEQLQRLVNKKHCADNACYTLGGPEGMEMVRVK